MSSTPVPPTAAADSPETRRYNSIHRWLGIADSVLGFALLVVLLATGWTRGLRDIAYRATFQHYALAVALYVLMLLSIGKLLGLGLDYYGFRLEHAFHLSNQKVRAWVWDETKGFLVSAVLAAIVAEVV